MRPIISLLIRYFYNTEESPLNNTINDFVKFLAVIDNGGIQLF